MAVFLHLLVGCAYVEHFGPVETRGILNLYGDRYFASFPSWNTDHEMDTAGFNRTATSILSTGLPRSRQGTLIWRTAVYSYYVAAAYAVGGMRLWSVLIAQALTSGVVCWLLGCAVLRMDPRYGGPALIAAALYAINLRVAMYVGYVVPLVPMLFFTALALWAATGQGRGATALFTGSLILGTYTSSTFFIVASAGAVWLTWRGRSFVGAAAIVAFVALKFVITWTDIAGSNAEANRSADRGGIFWLSNNPYYERMRPWSLWEWRGPNLWSAWRPTDEERQRYESYLERSGQNELRATLLWISENPGAYLQVCFARLRTEFGPYTGQMSPRNRLISLAVWLLIFPAGFYGLWKWRHHTTAQFVGLTVVAMFTFATLVTEEPYLRYRMPADLMLTAFAGLAYAERFRRATNSSNTATIR
jgi:4-amino-4-deoxy-L-arabinose transferase-like glycosyltransferase